MADRPDNPRAFPSSAIDDRLGGMTLRDWIAGQALSGLLSNCDNTGLNSWTVRDAAERAYDAADALMAEREKRG